MNNLREKAHEILGHVPDDVIKVGAIAIPGVVILLVASMPTGTLLSAILLLPIIAALWTPMTIFYCESLNRKEMY